MNVYAKLTRPMLFILLLWLVLFIQLMLAFAPVHAQEDTPFITNTPVGVTPAPVVVDDPAPSVGNDVFVITVIAGSLIVLGLIAAYAYYQGKTVDALYNSLPPEATGLIRMFLEFAANKAAATPSTADDEALRQLAGALGYQYDLTHGGRILLTPRVTPPQTERVSPPV